MEKIDIIAEQTKFLYNKQTEVLQFFRDEFAKLQEYLKTEQEKAEKAHAGDLLNSFQNVFTLLNTQEEASMKHLQEDVEFIEQQLKAIEQLQKMDDPAQAEEVVAMMLDEGHEVAETEQFKADVEAESEEAKKNYVEMMDDIKAVLEEDGVQELEKLLEAHAQELEKAAEHDEACDCDDEDCDESDEDCGSSCHSCSGCNVFEGLEFKLEDDENEDEDYDDEDYDDEDEDE